jgi:hypothetical protein
MSADSSMPRFALLSVAVALLLSSTWFLTASASAFELTEFDGTFENKNGSAAAQAASHPFQVVASLAVNTIQRENGEEVPEESIKDIRVELPPGLIGDPTAVAKCSPGELTGVEGFPECPPDSQVGVATVRLAFLGSIRDPNLEIFNIRPRPGAPAEFGLNLFSVPILLKAKLRTGGDYGLDLELPNSPQGLAVIGAKLKFWGVPGDSAHTRERGFDKDGRGCAGSDSDAASCDNEFTLPIRPFLTVPAACTASPPETRIRLNSWQHPELSLTESFFTHDNATPPNPVGVEGCDDPRLDLKPTLRIKPTTTEASSASGLDVNLELPTKTGPVGDAADLYVESGRDAAVAAPPLHTAVVSLPAGLTVNPAVANGLSACTNAQIELDGPNPAQCPDASKIGSADLVTPLLERPVKGSIYIARQGENKFGSLLAAYISLNDDPTGVVVKLAGRIEANGANGQLTARFDGNPQLPFSELRLKFFGGDGAAFITPEACGTYEANGKFSSWAAADPANPLAAETATASASFTIDRGANGQPCGGEHRPILSAGTTQPTAAAHSPFVLRLSRDNGTQRLSSVTARLPKGVLAKLAGVPYCPEAVLSSISTREGAAAGETAKPSCSPASQVGTVSVAVGAGAPFAISPGKVYLAGPYKGAPLSFAVIVPALAGPFDLGNVLVRVALQLDPETAQLTAVSDPLPRLLHGIALDVRSLSINVDRPQFIVNPTNCSPASVDVGVTSSRGATASLSQRFQVGGCQSLSFAPKLSLKLKGGTKRRGHPALRAVLKYPAAPGYTNVAAATVTLPPTAILDNANLTGVCTQPQFAANQCPPGSVYGSAKVVSPLLDQPLEGPVYLRANGGQRPLPDLVVDLNGQIRVNLVGRIDSTRGRLRTTFLGIPDAPISEFVLSLKGGRKGLLVNSANLCAQVNKAIVKISAQNGAQTASRPAVASSCKNRKKRSQR